MKIALWAGFALLALLWTGGAALFAQLAGWAAQALASGSAADWGQTAAAIRLPAWLAFWVDAGWLSALQELTVALLDGLAAGGPWAGAVIGWLVPAVWVTWALGLAALLAMALFGHWAAGRLGRAAPA
jgi:hypothetical protein